MPARERSEENVMTQYMVAIHHPDDFVPGSEGPDAMRDITALNKEMVAKGVRVFVGGMAPVSTRCRIVDRQLKAGSATLS